MPALRSRHEQCQNFLGNVNVNYLKEVLNTIEDEKITLTSFGNDKSALVKSNDPNQTLVLMPLLL